jgi:hypothetical protein
MRLLLEGGLVPVRSEEGSAGWKRRACRRSATPRSRRRTAELGDPRDVLEAVARGWRRFRMTAALFVLLGVSLLFIVLGIRMLLGWLSFSRLSRQLRENRKGRDFECLRCGAHRYSPTGRKPASMDCVSMTSPEGQPVYGEHFWQAAGG